MAINILDSETINKIAAGEVVEGPKAVVKELVENSIDANAKAITVEIKDGGIKMIRVTDDGDGIQNEDLPFVFKRHCTSKLKTIEDLDIIRSLGFRGEALSSISAVAQVELITKRRENLLGSRVVCELGEIVSNEEVGCGDGTTIVIKDLFYNAPARKKFLKSSNYEANKIKDIIERTALAHPEISFKLYINGQIRLNTPGNNKLKDVIYLIYGRDIAKNLIEINHSFYNMNITGYIASPLVLKANRSFENYFINGRFVKNFGINYAIEAGYFGRMMTGRFPFTCINIDIAPDMIDVNIHPAKLEIKFNNENELFSQITDVINERLDQTDIIPTVEVNKEIEKVENRSELYTSFNTNSHKIFENAKLEKFSAPEPFEIKRREVVQNTFKSYNEEKPKQIDIFKYVPDEIPKNVKIIGQAFKTYWLIELDDTLFIMDQHAAHEKVLFENILRMFKEKTVVVQELAIPYQINVSSQEVNIVKDYIPILQGMGIDIELYSNNTFIIRAIPMDFNNLDSEALINDMIAEIVEIKDVSKNEKVYIKVATIACKAAIKGNTNISEGSIKNLLDKLLKLENPYQCPHGRPTVIRFSKKDLDQKFARIV